MLAISGMNNIIHSPRSHTGKVKKAYFAVLYNSGSPYEEYFIHLEVLKIEEIVKEIYNQVYNQNDFYSDYADLNSDNPIMIAEFTEQVNEVIIQAFEQESYNFGQYLPDNFAMNFAFGVRQAILFDIAFDPSFD